MNIVLFGGPGSGKGTQSARLIDNYGLYHISTGDLLRNHIAQGTELGRTADAIISKGNLLPDELMIEILDNELNEKAKGVKGVIFDGFPRTIPQAIALEKLLEKHGEKLDAVIGLEVPEEELQARLLNRGKESGRSDDNIDVIKKRIDIYHSQTAPLREHYIGNGLYVPINGMGVVNDITDLIAEELKKRTGVEKR